MYTCLGGTSECPVFKSETPKTHLMPIVGNVLGGYAGFPKTFGIVFKQKCYKTHGKNMTDQPILWSNHELKINCHHRLNRLLLCSKLPIRSLQITLQQSGLLEILRMSRVDVNHKMVNQRKLCESQKKNGIGYAKLLS